ncbi:multiple epidermal growth factor-like domains protein 10 [Diabrotica virgifera virgifera]|uniref:Multiple epidermal growth factor-like domains protein 10 n=1 Tax=Diabrotica virgifera virgifera TaxID=50390 RepID=A0A6P7H0Q5_DIAVI|nr:multiple epidermal growth factor-like domains protein 10 [Diabrotica virgifera virgifera]
MMMCIFKCTFLFFLLCSIGVHADNCTENLNCAETQICVNGTCQCDILSYSKEDNPKNCLQYATEYNGYCQETKQCEWLGDNSVCFNTSYVCTCEPGYRWYRGKCEHFVGKGEACGSSSACFDGMDPLALTCDNNKCVCSDNYYDRGSDCRIKSDEHKACAINRDCDPTQQHGLICHLGICTNPNKLGDDTMLMTDEESYDEFGPLEQLLIQNNDKRTDECERDLDCSYMANSICDGTTKNCRCKNGNYFTFEGNCLPGFSACDTQNDICANDQKNSYCFGKSLNGTQGVCICKPGYFFYKKQCVPELGVPDPDLQKDTDCKIRPGKVFDGACYCKDYWFGDRSNRNCIKTTLQQTYSCLTNDWCNAMGPYSYCNSSNLCQCSNPQDFDEENFYCNAPAFDVECLRDYDCAINQRCVDNNCTCLEHFMTKEGNEKKCFPALEGSCDTFNNCFEDVMECMGGVCNCISDYIGYGSTCLKIANNWDDNCTVTAQCREFKFSECSSKRQKCACKKKYVLKSDDKCWEEKNHGDPCMTSEQCTVVLDDSYQCRNNKCLFPIGQDVDSGSPVLTFSSTMLSLCTISSLYLIGIIV